MVYPLINNYKAQRNVRAELSGAVDLGEPVSLYIAEDEIKITGNNILNDNAYKDYAVTGDGGWSKYGDNVITTTDTSVRIASDGSGHESGAYVYFRDNVRSFVDNDLVVGRQYVLSCFVLTDSSTAYIQIAGGNLANGTTGTGQKELRFTAGSANGQYLRLASLDTGAEKFVELSNIKLFEVTDHTYKLMAVNDTIPSGGINTEAEGSEMITQDTTDHYNRSFTGAGDWVGYGSPDEIIVGAGKLDITTNGDSSTEGATLQVSNYGANLTAPVAGKTYRIRAKLEDKEAGGSAHADATYKFQFGGTAEYIQASDSTPSDGTITTTEEEYYADVVAANTTGDLIVLIPGGANNEETRFTIDDVSVKELYGYDYYNAPAYKFGIVSSVYDKDTGAMKTVGAAGDQVEVTVQGECNAIGPSSTETAGSIIRRISTNGSISDTGAGDTVLPNGVGVCVGNSSSTVKPLILFQGVEFSESFVHKNSLQVKAKCDETITKFRPVSLYLDSNGDLLCRHDDIPAELPDADTDHTGVDPGKWGIAELGGVSGEIIPVTVAGKTHFNTNSTMQAGWVIKQLKEGGVVLSDSSGSNNYIPNALGTTMGNHTISSHNDIPITIFGGTPIGTITNWKRTIKVTAKANGAITQYCPVSLYLDQYGNYKCISDSIPNASDGGVNAIWCDFRKWGIAQTTVADGENVEVIVQGRTNVVDAKDSANRTEFVSKITSGGTVFSYSSTSNALSSLGIVEKESQISDGEPGVIIIF